MSTHPALSLSVGAAAALHVVLAWTTMKHGVAHDLQLLAGSSVAASLAATAASFVDGRAARPIVLAVTVFSILALCAAADVVALGGYSFGVIVAAAAVTTLGSTCVQAYLAVWPFDHTPSFGIAREVGRQQSAQHLGKVVGPLGGGCMLEVWGTSAAVALVAATLLACLAFIPSQKSATDRAWACSVMPAFRASMKVPLERRWLLNNGVVAALLVPALLILAPLKVASITSHPTWLGVGDAAVGIGVVAGGLGIGGAFIAAIGRFRARIAFDLAQALLYAAIGCMSSPAGILVSLWMIGLSDVTMTLSGFTHRSLARPSSFRARMQAISNVCTLFGALIGTGVCGIVLRHTSVNGALVAFGAAAALASASLALTPGIRRFLELAPPEAVDWYERNFPDAFR